MDTILTTLLLALITVMAAWRHVRSHARATRAASAAPNRCPRCRAHVKEGALSCRSCGVPLQAFEVVSARAVAGASGGDDQGRLHGVVRKDMCVGCGTCVPACPEPGAIRLVEHQAVIDLAHCVGHGLCASACPVGAIFMSTGESTQRMEVPALDRSFQSNVAGLYIVGELGGRGLIKNAINEGRIAVEHVVSEMKRQRGVVAVAPGTHDVVIVGAGPAGISAGLEALQHGLRYVVLERDTLADTIRRYPRHKMLLAEPVKMPLYGQLWVADASKESLLKVWEKVIAETKLQVLTRHEVTSIGRSDGLFQVEASGKVFLARRVVLALGRRGTPRRLGSPGEELAKVLYDIIEMEAFASRRVLVVGGGDSAVESAVGLSRQPGAQVTLSYRGGEFTRIKSRNQAKLGEAVQAGRLRLLLRSTVKEIRPEEVVLEVEGQPLRLPNDDVIVRVGGEPPFEFLRRVGVEMVRKDVPVVGSGGAVDQPEAARAAAR